MTYVQQERGRAARWKATSDLLPDSAREPAPFIDHAGREQGLFPFCLPRADAGHNLLPHVRDGALELFEVLRIPWHCGIDGGPGNHLLSSQVQCVNALLPMVSDPDLISRAFGSVVDVGEVEPIEPGRCLTFEYIGPVDFFHESPGRQRVRGSLCTSVDAAFRHRTRHGSELVLIEWKYTERYLQPHRDHHRDTERERRYGGALAAPDGPIRSHVLTFDRLVDEPFYQLVRQQLLAHELERSGVADRVVVVHVRPIGNHAYTSSLPTSEHRALGVTVDEAWASLLRRADRYRVLDADVFHDPAITSETYHQRYGHDEAETAA